MVDSRLGTWYWPYFQCQQENVALPEDSLQVGSQTDIWCFTANVDNTFVQDKMEYQMEGSNRYYTIVKHFEKRS